MKLEDINGRKYSAQTIFTLSIKALVDHFQLHLKKQILSKLLSKKDIRWILTVPAIWSDAAKRFMRKCAVDVRKTYFIPVQIINVFQNKIGFR